MKALHNDKRFEISLVVSQPAKPVGREQVVTDSPVATFAKENNLRLATPETLRQNTDIVETVKNIAPDFLLVVAFGKIIPNELLGLAKHGAVNIHPSLLPKYRGASPLQMSIAHGEAETAVTIMLMDAEVDHGAILVQIPDQITESDTTTTLGEKLFKKAADVLPQTLIDFASGKIKAQTQNHENATFTKLIDRADGKLTFDTSAKLIDAKRRGFTPWPGVHIELGDGFVIKVLDTEAVKSCTGFVPGALHEHENELHVATNDGCVWLKSVQPAGKNPMPGEAFIRGYSRYLSLRQ